MRPDGKKEGLRQSMSWLHTWTGIVLGWLLYAVFFTGTLSYFLDEINLWMHPELHRSVPSTDTVDKALAGMQAIAPGASMWTLTLPDARQTTVSASWREAGSQATGRAGLKRAELDAATGEAITTRETRGGNFLYRFHFELHALPRNIARWIVGIATMFMLVAIISGVITHKKIFTDFFTFRPRKGQRSWLDAHNATAVLALPFHLVITFSGLLLLMYMLMPWGMEAAYQGDRQAFFTERRAAGAGGGGGGNQTPHKQQRSADVNSSGIAAIAPMLAEANRQWDGRAVGSITINRPGKPGSTIELRESGGNSLTTRGASRRLVFDASNGLLVATPTIPSPSGASAVYNVMTATHLGRFAGPAMRWILFLSGVIGTAMVGTGLALWVVKRLPERRKLGYTPIGHRLIEVTNVGVIAGIGLATAVYFWLNRLLPAEMTGRLDWEIKGFFIAWGISLLHALLRPHRTAWIEQCIVISLLFGLLPLLNPLTGGHGLFDSLALGQMSIAGFDLCMLAIAMLFAFIARKLIQKGHAVAADVKKPIPAIVSSEVSP